MTQTPPQPPRPPASPLLLRGQVLLLVVLALVLLGFRLFFVPRAWWFPVGWWRLW